MSYGAIETKLLTLLRTISGLTSSNCVAGDDSILDRGITQGIIIDAGRGPINGPDDLPMVTREWDCKIALYVRITTKAAAHTALVSLRQSVVDLLQKYPTLGASYVFGSNLQGGEDPTDVQLTVNDQPAGPVFRTQTLTLTVREFATPSGGSF